MLYCLDIDIPYFYEKIFSKTETDLINWVALYIFHKSLISRLSDSVYVPVSVSISNLYIHLYVNIYTYIYTHMDISLSIYISVEVYEEICLYKDM